MKKRMLSILLVLCMVLGMLPAAEVRAEGEVQTHVIRLGWVQEEGRWLWESYVDAGGHRVQNGTLPGVKLNGNRLTLENVSVNNFQIEAWGKDPVEVVVSGNVSVHGSPADYAALAVRASWSVTISGAHGDGTDRLSLTDGDGWLLHDVAPLHEGLERCFTERDLLTVKDLTLNLETECWGTVYVVGGSTFSNVTVTTAGSGRLLLFGPTTIDRCDIDASELLLSSPYRELAAIGAPQEEIDRICSGDSHGGVTSEITNSTIRLTSNPITRQEQETMLDVEQTVLTLENNVITVDASEASPDSLGLQASGDREQKQFGPKTGVYMNSGSLNIIMQPSDELSEDRGYSTFCLFNGAFWRQSGGDVHVTIDAGDNGHSVQTCTAGDACTFDLSGGTFTVENLCSDEVWDTQVMALSGWNNSELNFSGGTFTATGASEKPYDVSVWVYGKMTVTGDARLDLKSTLQTETMESHIEFFGGETYIHSPANGVVSDSAVSVYGGKLTVEAPEFQVGFFSLRGNIRFLGGETDITAGSALLWQGRENQMTFGDGVKAAFPDGTEAEVSELYYNDRFIAWATNPDFLLGSGVQHVTICRQGVKASENSLMLDIPNSSALVVGAPVNFRVIPVLASAGAQTLTITLPQDYLMGAVTVNNEKVTFTGSNGTYEVQARNGDVVRFSATPTKEGPATVSVSTGSTEAALPLSVEGYSLSLPSRVREPSFAPYGTAAPGAVITFWEPIGESSEQLLGKATANALGRWKANITLDSAGVHTIFARIELDGKVIATTKEYQVEYDTTRASVRSLTITNGIHGLRAWDPIEEQRIVLNYESGTRSGNYYVYWPDEPWFSFEVELAGEDWVLEDVSHVWVVATDLHGTEERVPLDPGNEPGVWLGGHNFCDGENIIPQKFRVEWSEYGISGNGGTDDMPTLEAPPEEKDENDSTMAVDYADPGTYTLELAPGARVASVLELGGDNVSYSVSGSSCAFDVQTGRFYLVKLEKGSFAKEEFRDYEKLLVIVHGDSGRAPVTVYRPGVVQLTAQQLSDFNRDTMTFTSSEVFTPGAVLVIDEKEAVVVTGQSGSAYTFRDADLDEVYDKLFVDSFDYEGIHWDTDDEAMAEAFRNSPLFDQIQAALEATFQVTYKNEDLEVAVKTTYSVNTDGVLAVSDAITITAKGKTTLPVVGEQDTTMTVTLSAERALDLDFLASLDSKKDVYITTLGARESATLGLDFDLTVGDDSLTSHMHRYFGQELNARFLKELKVNLEDSYGGERYFLGRLVIPTGVPGVMGYAELSLEFDASFFGEHTSQFRHTNGRQYGFSVMRIEGEWDTDAYAFTEKPSISMEEELHVVTQFTGFLRLDLGLSLLRVYENSIYVKAGPRLTMAGHGKVSFTSDQGGSALGVDAEVFARLSLVVEAGVHLKAGIPGFSAEWNSKPLLDYEKTMKEIGWDQMPTGFTVVETVQMLTPSSYDLCEYMDLRMNRQSFRQPRGGIHVYRENNYERYSFKVLSGPVDIYGEHGDAHLRVKDPTKSCDYRLRITFTSNSYELYKDISLHYEPYTIPVVITAEEVAPIAPVSVERNRKSEDGKMEPAFRQTKTINGSGSFTVEPGEYTVTEISPPPKNVLESPNNLIAVVHEDGSVDIVQTKMDFALFVNRIPRFSEDIPLPGIGDPSGYVFEGIESNRLEDVETTIYYKPTEDSREEALWDAGEFDQMNPLYTDAAGQYAWMVPNGWWQVRYEKEGYFRETSDWMEVPPIRTGVNVGLTSPAPAQMWMEVDPETGEALLRFDRPVKNASLSNAEVYVDGVRYEDYYVLEGVDTAWSVTQDPRDSTPCSTVLRLRTDEYLSGKTLQFLFPEAETYYGTVHEASGQVTLPVHECANRCKVCGGCRDRDCKNAACRRKCTPVSNFFKDVKDNAWYADAVEYVYLHGIMNGISADRFDPSGIATRAMIVTMIARAAGADVNGGSPWYAKAVAWGMANGITDGTNMSSPITREQIVTMLYRYSGAAAVEADLSGFTDANKIHSWALAAMKWAVSSGLIQGNDKHQLTPVSQATRAEIATMFWRFCELTNR